MLGPSASLVIIVYGERHSHAWAPSALFSLVVVVKLREAAFGSLGLKRLCSRTCLVLICCTQSSINILRTVHSLIIWRSCLRPYLLGEHLLLLLVSTFASCT